jgi:hypothetical protein
MRTFWPLNLNYVSFMCNSVFVNVKVFYQCKCDVFFEVN